MNSRKGQILVYFSLLAAVLSVWAYRNKSLKQAVSGAYDLSVEYEKKIFYIGTLTLVEGEYVFDFQDKYEIPTAARSTLPDFTFLSNTRGRYQIAYSSGVSAVDFVSRISYGAAIGTICFRVPRENRRSVSQFNALQIRIDSLGHKVFFQALHGKLQSWAITKGL